MSSLSLFGNLKYNPLSFSNTIWNKENPTPIGLKKGYKIQKSMNVNTSEVEGLYPCNQNNQNLYSILNKENIILVELKIQKLMGGNTLEVESLYPINQNSQNLHSIDKKIKDGELEKKINLLEDQLNNINIYLNKEKVKDSELEKQIEDKLNNLHKECEEEGYQCFSKEAENTARDILYKIQHKFPTNEYFVYPTAEREIAIDCTPEDKKGVLILCDSRGGIACFVTIDGKNRRCRYDKYSDFSYDFLWKSFTEIKNTSYSSSRNNFPSYPERSSFLSERYKEANPLSTIRIQYV